VPDAPTASPLFDSAFLAKLEQLYLLARKLFRGDQRAERRSQQIGSSLEFADYRNYSTGDDLRNIDWNIYGRLDRLFIKLFEEEQDLHIYLLVDASASMLWTPRAGALTKFDQARRIAASLGYIGLANLDRINVLYFDATLGRDTGFMRGKSQFYKALDFLRAEPPTPRETNLAETCRVFARRMKRRGLVFVLSDFFDPHGYDEALALLRHHQFDVHAVQIADPAELDPVLSGDLRLEEIETGERIEVTVDATLATAYRKQVRTFLDDLQRFCRKRQIGLAQATTETPFEDLVLKVLREGRLLK
jgi:uncharacterized protein (DUF58 family)